MSRVSVCDSIELVLIFRGWGREVSGPLDALSGIDWCTVGYSPIYISAI